MFRFLLLQVLLLGFMLIGGTRCSPPATYRAAVLQHAVLPFHKSGLDTMMRNVKIYAEMSAKAARQGAQVIVFPEYGITSFIPGTGRKRFDEFAQDIPDPKKFQWNPCTETSLHRGNIRVLQELSCIARNNSLALIANLISRVPCDPSTSSQCRADRQLLFNTNVIFGANGTLLATYHKRHLYDENDLDPATEVELTIVDLGFVKLATFICFDILFADPAIRLIQDRGIKNIAFPTAWINEMPFLMSVQTFAGFAHGLGINLLAANIYKPTGGFLGSGIYSSSRGGINETFDLTQSETLLIADVPIEPLPAAKTTTEPANNIRRSNNANVKINFKKAFISKPSAKIGKPNHLIWFQDMRSAKFEILKDDNGYKAVCKDELCCALDYAFKPVTPNSTNVQYALLAFSDMHGEGEQRFFIQTCAVVLCENGNNCGHVVTDAHHKTRHFERFALYGNFSSQYLFPNVLSENLRQVPPKYWSFRKTGCSTKACTTASAQLESKTTLPEHLLVARIMGRDYRADNPSDESNRGIGLLDYVYDAWKWFVSRQ